jgi:pimeloyl-ACP methyl ester carboxylesterase
MNTKQEIKEVVDYFLANDKLFTTVDVANKLKEKNLFIKHSEVRDEVRSLYHNHMVNNNYCRTIITVTLKDKKQAETTNKEGVKAAQLGMAERPNRTEILENLDAKILIIAGKYDNAVKTENLLKIIPEKTNIKTYVLDCGHNGHWEKPTICAEIINTELLHNLPKHFLL